jgi:hypothetical protein
MGVTIGPDGCSEGRERGFRWMGAGRQIRTLALEGSNVGMGRETQSIGGSRGAVGPVVEGRQFLVVGDDLLLDGKCGDGRRSDEGGPRGVGRRGEDCLGLAAAGAGPCSVGVKDWGVCNARSGREGGCQLKLWRADRGRLTSGASCTGRRGRLRCAGAAGGGRHARLSAWATRQGSKRVGVARRQGACQPQRRAARSLGLRAGAESAAGASKQ